ncbi:SpoIIE family protein phosphatase [Gemmatimonas aurantiaca]|uniref:PP2C family protein-serine/threonine phosphatase n=1 Tax=Gemmatimonas aurantiaca TaxID=173480 RepID=UPI00301E49F2
MNEVAALLAAFLEATGRQAAIWERREGSVAPTLLGASSEVFAERTASCAQAWDVVAWARSHGLHAQLVNTGESVGWLFVESVDADDAAEAMTSAMASAASAAVDADRLLGRLLPLVRRITRERDGATRELAERYEEINLLYAIGELLGGTTSVESVADTLLAELAATLGARRAVFLQTNRAHGTLTPVATLGLPSEHYEAVSLEQASHIAVRAYHAGSACTEDGSAASLADPVLAAGGAPLMAVAITRPSTGLGITGTFAVPTRRGADGVAVPMGVLVLAGRPGGSPFSGGDRKLAVAIGTQVGVAMHNASLVRAAVERQQLAREMRLAHELQLKLLPNPAVVQPEARAAARVVPAELVGGDFYLLARLDRDRTGVLIGDVSGHGYQSALVMALALSAAAIHVQAAFDPSIAIEAVQRSLREELMSTEMSISICYAVIDSRAHEVRFANAGHPHAFKLSADGQTVRLGAVAPPIGFSDQGLEECVMSWRPGDRLVFFTDGLVDARDAAGRRLGEPAVLDLLASMNAGQTPAAILDGIYDRMNAHIERTPLRDDCTVVVVDRP